MRLTMLDQLFDATFLYPIVIALFFGAAELDGWIGDGFTEKQLDQRIWRH